MFDFAPIAAAHGIETDRLAGWVKSRGWDFSKLDLSDATAVNVVSDVVTGYAADIAKGDAQRKAAIARAEARKPRKTFLAQKHPHLVCGKCDGAGIINGFNHIEGGVCFACNQSGIIRIRRAV